MPETTVTWTFTMEQLVYDLNGEQVWERTGGIEVSEATARQFYYEAMRAGLPNHLRRPRLTRVTREIIEEND